MSTGNKVARILSIIVCVILGFPPIIMLWTVMLFDAHYTEGQGLAAVVSFWVAMMMYIIVSNETEDWSL